jgi:O-antigen ligase
MNGAAARTLPLARILLGVMLFAAPLPFGAVFTWAWGSLTIITLLVLILWMVGCIQDGRLKLGYSPLYVPLALMLVLGWMQLSFHLTLTPTATKESIFKLGTYFVLFFVVIQLFSGSSETTWRRVGIAVLSYGFLFSFLSILQSFWNPARIFLMARDIGAPFGPYVDRDHYAGLMEMLIPVSATYALSRPKHDPLNGILWFSVVIQGVSLLLTGSRGGFVALLVEMAILGWIINWRNPLPGRRVRAAMIGSALVVVAALFFWLVPTYVLAKIGTMNSYVSEAKLGRPILWKDSLQIFRDHPLAGTGLGSYVTVYPLYQTEASDLVTEHAHNDYLEALTETGVPGGILIFAALLLFIPITFRNLTARLKREPGYLQLGAGIACCGLLIHSFFDFNLQIPANAAWFTFCAGLAALSGQVFPRAGKKPEAGRFKPGFGVSYSEPPLRIRDGRAN